MFTLTKKDFPNSLFVLIQPTGSKYICNPPVMNTDEDYFIWGFKYEEIINYLVSVGYEPCCEQHYTDTKFTALRKGSLNLIIVHDKSEYEKCVMATNLAKRFNLVNKQDRVDLFELVRNGYYEGYLFGDS